MATIGWPRELRRGSPPPAATRRACWPRRAWSSNESRWSALSELGLAVLQVADWAGADLRPGHSDTEVAILFTDLVGFSSWALSVGDEDSLEALRRIDATITAVVEEHEGEVVKRLGDGTMAVFADAGCALLAAEACVHEVGEVRCDGYDTQMRAGLHFGTPQPIGVDYLGVDVNIAAHLCEAAEPNEVLISEAVRGHLHARKELGRPPRRELDGVPKGLEIYSVSVNGARA